MPSGTSLSLVDDVALEVAVLGERPGLHGAERAHAPVLLVALALVEHDLARRLVDAGEQAAEHHDVGAGGDGLGDVAGELDAAVGDERDAVARAAAAQSWMAVTCGTPTPATTRVVQIDPGPTPTFTPSAPAATMASTASAVTTLPPITSTSKAPLIAFTTSSTPDVVAVGGVDDEQVDADVDERLGPLERVGPDADGGADPEAAPLVLRWRAGTRSAS